MKMQHNKATQADGKEPNMIPKKLVVDDKFWPAAYWQQLYAQISGIRTMNIL